MVCNGPFYESRVDKYIIFGGRRFLCNTSINNFQWAAMYHFFQAGLSDNLGARSRETLWDLGVYLLSFVGGTPGGGPGTHFISFYIYLINVLLNLASFYMIFEVIMPCDFI